jgi:tetratricopeptide (TPR) repeat protein
MPRNWFLLMILAPALGGAGMSFVADTDDEQLWHYRNLGKAFYENPTTQFQAVEMFERALKLAPDSPRERLNYGLALIRAGRAEEGVAKLLAVQKQAPEIPHTWFNLGIIYKKEARYAESRDQFEEMVRLVPDEPISHYNLGVTLRLTGDQDRALRHFEKAAELDPNMAGPFFQMYNAYRAQGREEGAAEALRTFQENRRRQAGAAIPEDLDWSYYAEILDIVDPVEEVALSPSDFASGLVYEKRFLEGPVKTGLGLLPIALDVDEVVGLLAWSEASLFHYPAASSAARELYRLESGRIRTVVPGDFNNDGLIDLCLVLDEGAVLLENREGRFEKVQRVGGSNSYTTAVWHDFDHDSDLDLFLLGSSTDLYRNNGGSGFSRETDLFPFVEGEAVAGVVIDLVKDTNNIDMVFAYKDRPAVLYRDRLAGNFEAIDLPVVDAGTRQLWIADLDNDGWTDFVGLSDRGLRAYFNREGVFQAGQHRIAGSGPVALADLTNRGFVDLVFGSDIYMHKGQGRFEKVRVSTEIPSPAALVAYDFDADGRVDLAVLTGEGRVAVLAGGAEVPGNWVIIELSGVRNPKLAPAAEVEVKAGALYQKKLYFGLPLHFGLGDYSKVDTVRITWPNGLIQNEPEQEVGQAFKYEEQQRLSGSCPMVFTWNGDEFEFITDVLAVAPLGAAAGDGVFFPVDNDEYVQIAAESMARNERGLYEIRITEELREIGYLDKVKLYAVDRPEDTGVYTSDKFKSPPFPEFRLYGVRDRIYPKRAVDHRGNDVTEKILHRDQRYPSNFERDLVGVAETHFLELDFGPNAAPDNQAILVLHGWVDWADGSTIRRLAQDESTRLVMPYLQVLDEKGRWVTAIEDMGVPAGKPKTIVVDLSGHFRSAERRVRIVTNLCVYWDEIFLGEETAEPAVDMRALDLHDAQLVYRGFSRPIVHPERLQPETFDYSQWMPVSMWNPADGFYTRYGDVKPLLERIDDKFVIMGAGDELRLLFDDRELPPVAEGFARDFILFVDGWAKDGDLNTAFSQTVEPLPFHGMSAYPYPDDESYPDTEEHRRYRDTYNTRPALRFLRPLDEERGVVASREAGVRSEE